MTDSGDAALLTLPWRGRVDRLSDSESGRGGVSFSARYIHPTPLAKTLATLPLQGRVKKRIRAAEPHTDFIQSPLDCIKA